MSKTTNSLNKLSKNIKLLQGQNPLILLFLLIVGIIFIVCPLACIFSLLAFYFPWIPGVVVPICTAIFLCLYVYGFIIKSSRCKIWKKAKSFIILPWCFWGSVFIFGFVCWFFSNSVDFKMVSSKIRFPLSDVRQIAVDSKGNIYCLSRNYNRIQVFSDDGAFINGWFINSSGPYYRLLTNSKDNLQVATKNNSMSLFFNIKGDLIKKETIVDFDKQFGLDMPREINDLAGNNYEIRKNELFGGVIKSDDSGIKKIFIKNPFGLWVVSPFLGIICIVGTSFVYLSMSIFLSKKSCLAQKNI